MRCPVPVLDFLSNHGLDAPEFATFRIGVAWAKRIPLGSRVVMVHDKIAIGSRIVSLIETGKIRDVLAKHALKSHLEVGGDGDPIAAAERRFVSIQKLYGPRIVTDSKMVTVIYLRRP